MQTTAASQATTGEAMHQVGTTLWYHMTNATKQWWDFDYAYTVYDGITPVTPVAVTPDGYVLLAAAPVGLVTADYYYAAVAQIGGFRSHSIDESMGLVECSCYEDLGEQYEADQYSASGQAEGFWTSTNASLTTAKGSNKDLTFTSKLLGTAGNAISITSVVSGSLTALTIAVVTYDITINSATNVGSEAISTAREILDALQASDAAMALIKVKLASGSNGIGVFGALTKTQLAGGIDFTTGLKASLTTSQGSNKDLKFEAIAEGVAGNSITIEYTSPAGINALDVSIISTDIVVTLQTTDGTGISTALEVMAALNGHPAALALMETSVAYGSSGAEVVGDLAHTHLAGGQDDSDPDRWADDLIGVFYWDSGASLIRTVGRMTLEGVNLKGGVKGLVGKTINFKFQSFLFDHSG